MNVPRLVPIMVALAVSWSCSSSPSSTTSPSATVSSVAVSGATSVSSIGQTVQLTATATFSDGTTQNVTATAMWQSSNTGVATVTSGGLVTAVTSGTVTVTATYQGKAATATVAIAISSSSQGTMTAIIDGTPFVGTNVTATYFAGANFSTLLINALDAAGNLLSFDIGPPLQTAFTTGTYPLGSNGSNATYNPFGTVGNTGWTGLTGPQSGSVIVTAFSTTTKTASGTFSFVLHNSTSAKTVTNGVFNVTFP